MPRSGTWITAAAGAPDTVLRVELPGPHVPMGQLQPKGATTDITIRVPVLGNPLGPIEVPEAAGPTNPRERPSQGAVGTADLPAAVGVRVPSKGPVAAVEAPVPQDRKSTRLNSSHVKTSYAV